MLLRFQDTVQGEIICSNLLSSKKVKVYSIDIFLIIHKRACLYKTIVDARQSKPFSVFKAIHTFESLLFAKLKSFGNPPMSFSFFPNDESFKPFVVPNGANSKTFYQVHTKLYLRAYIVLEIT